MATVHFRGLTSPIHWYFFIFLGEVIRLFIFWLLCSNCDIRHEKLKCTHLKTSSYSRSSFMLLFSTVVRNYFQSNRTSHTLTLPRWRSRRFKSEDPGGHWTGAPYLLPLNCSFKDILSWCVQNEVVDRRAN